MNRLLLLESVCERDFNFVAVPLLGAILWTSQYSMGTTLMGNVVILSHLFRVCFSYRLRMVETLLANEDLNVANDMFTLSRWAGCKVFLKRNNDNFIYIFTRFFGLYQKHFEKSVIYVLYNL